MTSNSIDHMNIHPSYLGYAIAQVLAEEVSGLLSEARICLIAVPVIVFPPMDICN